MNKIVETLKIALKTRNGNKIEQLKRQIFGYNPRDYYPSTTATQIDYALECAYQCGVNDERSRKQTSVQVPKESTMVVVVKNPIEEMVCRYRVNSSQMNLLEQLFDDEWFDVETEHYLEEDMPKIIDLT